MAKHKRRSGLKNAYMLAGMRLGMLLRLFLRHGVSLRLRPLLRALFLLQAGFWASVVAWADRRLTKRHRKPQSPARDPIFIVGHWRTGSTYLHQLLGLDPALAAPTLFQCCFPDSFETSRIFVEPFVGRSVTGHRPMDEVKVHMDAPHEDEFALLRLVGCSPLERLIFPRDGRYFLLGDESYLPFGPDLAAWEKALASFAARLHAHTDRRPVFKNPFHSLRIPVLARLFPEALFVHIHRNPLDVIPSTIHMWSIVGRQNCLRQAFAPPSEDEVIDVYERMLGALRRDLSALPEERRAEIGFDRLEASPEEAVRELYSKLKLDFTDEHRRRMAEFLVENRAYRKNEHALPAESAARIRRRLGAHMAEYGYRTRDLNVP